LNEILASERALLDALARLSSDPWVSHRWLSIARTNLEQGFMAARRAVLEPHQVLDQLEIEEVISRASN